MVVRIAVDAMGGDFAPGVNLEGTRLALEEAPDLEIILVGRKEAFQDALKNLKLDKKPNVSCHEASEVVDMDDHAASSLRRKKDSSIGVGLNLLKEGKADAFISAGHSGAVMAGALMTLGRLPGVERPAIVVRLPTAEGSVVLLDVGANVDCKPSHLVQFAEMGHVFAQVMNGIDKPRVALLSNGSEDHKGNQLTRKVDELLRETKSLSYRGYVEGFDLFRGTADVVVCDGFVGNVALKLSEGLADTLFQWFRSQVRKNLLGVAGVLLMRGILLKFRKKFDYQPYGAAPLLGIDGMVWISHGSSTPVAIQSGILNAKKGVEQGFLDRVRKQLGTSLGSSEIRRKR